MSNPGTVEYIRHGWVTPLASGARARCGGPPMCGVCKFEQDMLRIGTPPSDLMLERHNRVFK